MPPQELAQLARRCRALRRGRWRRQSTRSTTLRRARQGPRRRAGRLPRRPGRRGGAALLAPRRGRGRVLARLRGRASPAAARSDPAEESRFPRRIARTDGRRLGYHRTRPRRPGTARRDHDAGPLSCDRQHHRVAPCPAGRSAVTARPPGASPPAARRTAAAAAGHVPAAAAAGAGSRRVRARRSRRDPDRPRVSAGIGRLRGVQEQLLAVVAPAGDDRPELVRLRGGRLAARLDPRRAQPTAGAALADQPVDGEGDDRGRGPALLPARRRRLSWASSGPPGATPRPARSSRAARRSTQQLVRNLYISNERTLPAEDQGGLPRDQARASTGRRTGSWPRG